MTSGVCIVGGDGLNLINVWSNKEDTFIIVLIYAETRLSQAAKMKCKKAKRIKEKSNTFAKCPK